MTHSNYDANTDSLNQKLRQTPDYLSSIFGDRSSVSNCSLRDKDGKLTIPQPHTNYMKSRSAMRTWGLMLSFIQKSVSGRIATSEKVIKSLQFLSGKSMSKCCLLTLSSNNNYAFSLSPK